MQEKTLPNGVWPVMLTPFHDDGAIDWHGVDALIEWYIEAGAAGLFAVCLSSEMYALTPEERIALAAHVVTRTAGRVPVVAPGTFSETASDHAAFIRQMTDTGVDAVVLIPCQLVREEEEEPALQNALESIMEDTAELPLGLYECPQPYHRLISADLLGWAARSGRFLFLKETSARLDLLEAKCSAVQNTPLQLYNAHSPSVLDGLRMGAAGCSNIAANLYPRLFSWLCRYHETNAQLADELGDFLALTDPLVRLEYPAGAKQFLQSTGLPIRSACRLSVPRRKDDDLSSLHKVLAKHCKIWENRLPQ